MHFKHRPSCTCINIIAGDDAVWNAGFITYYLKHGRFTLMIKNNIFTKKMSKFAGLFI